MKTLNLTWDQLNDVKSPAATIGATDALVELIESTIAEQGRVTFAAADGTITDVLNNAGDLERWKEQNAAWLGDDDADEDNV